MHRFKSAILAKMKNCQNGTFEPVHEIQNFFWPKAFFWGTMKMAIRKNIHNLSQGWPNPGFMQEKVHKGDFLKKDSGELIFVLFCFRFLWSPRAWNARLGVGIFFGCLKTCTVSVLSLYFQCCNLNFRVNPASMSHVIKWRKTWKWFSLFIQQVTKNHLILHMHLLILSGNMNCN